MNPETCIPLSTVAYYSALLLAIGGVGGFLACVWFREPRVRREAHDDGKIAGRTLRCHAYEYARRGGEAGAK